MATRSTISKQLADGSVRTIYSHWDGYPDHHLPLLQEFYNTEEKVDQLLDLGNISSLAENAGTPPKEHSFDTRVDGYVVAYGRDRGETDQHARIYISFKSAQKESYNYLFKDGKWTYTIGSN